MGGCCSLLPGALAGARRVDGRVGLVYLDGHLDLYDGVTSPTGEAADMPISVVLGRGPQAWVDAAGSTTDPERRVARSVRATSKRRSATDTRIPPTSRGCRSPTPTRSAPTGAGAVGRATDGSPPARPLLGPSRCRRARRSGVPRDRLPDARRAGAHAARRSPRPAAHLAVARRRLGRLLQPRQGPRRRERRGARRACSAARSATRRRAVERVAILRGHDRSRSTWRTATSTARSSSRSRSRRARAQVVIVGGG